MKRYFAIWEVEEITDPLKLRIHELEAALRRAHDKLKLCVTAGVLRHDLNVFLAAEADVLGSSVETVCDAPESQTMPHEHVGSPTVDRGETCLRCGQDMHAPIHTAKIKVEDR